MPTDLHFQRQTAVPASPAELFAWHARPGAFERLAPPWQRFAIAGGDPRIRNGSRVVLRMRKGPLAFRWVAEHQRVEPGAGFRDVQVSGPFALWEHDHLFEPLADGGALLHDRIRYRPPAGPLGRWLVAGALRRDLERTFRYRHATTAADLELHHRWAGGPPLRVAITGASGLVGSTLAALLSTGGHRVVRLVRGPAANEDEVSWDPAHGLLHPSALEGVDAVVHLAGESIAGGRWSARRKRRIRASRVDGTRHLVASLARLARPPRVLVSASAVGFYGDRGEQPLDESAPRGDGFLAEVCVAWEEEALAARDHGIRVALARFGVVLSPAGGFLGKVLTPFSLGLGGRLGDGDQRLSWIGVDDAAAALLHLVRHPDASGPFNLTAPEVPTNAELTHTLARVLGRPALLPVPAAAARAAFGELATETMLASTRAVPAKLEAGGYHFRHAELEPALRHLLGRGRP